VAPWTPLLIEGDVTLPMPSGDGYERGRAVSAAINEVVRVVLSQPARNGVIGMITAYFDDTGTHARSAVVGFGGLFGTSAQWNAFDLEWRSTLRAPLPGKLPLRRFHMTECMARDGEFEGYSEGERDAIIHDFRKIIIRSEVSGYAVVASKKDWDTMIVPPLRYVIGDAEIFCFRACVGKMASYIHNHSNDAELAFIFDDRPKWEAISNFIMRQYQEMHLRTKFAGLSFLSNEKVPALQGADMFAWEVYRHASEHIANGGRSPPRPHAVQFFQSDRFEMHWLDRASVQEFSGLLGVPQA